MATIRKARLRDSAAVIFLLSLVVSCAHLDEVSVKNSLQANVLTQEMAEIRRAQIDQVEYDLKIDVTTVGDEFKGDQTITFELKKLSDVWFEFQEGQIIAAEVNGRSKNLSRGPVYVRLAKEDLQLGMNLVRIQYTHEYSRSGKGLHRFRDPEDGQTYLYTQFEPFDASRWAPFFDQPDIKAPLTLTVKAPIGWEVITNSQMVSAENSESKDEQKVKVWTFQKTAPISSYLYAMVAGPYVHWQDQYNMIPLGIYARRSLAKYVPYKEWFKITKQGLEFYEDYFQIHYPFGKYDQLLVPEFNAGAMENVGAVTFSERYIRRGEATRSERVRMYNTVLHEMAHMWFGDLVTMKWWNDLWLNESFATYMSMLAEAKATEYKEVWARMQGEKRDAYYQDEMTSTHPISGVVQNSNEAFSNFDDITYGKGASVMRELSFYIGAENFRNALRDYFKKHAYQNTTLHDFVAAFERTTKIDMKSWFHAWLETTGMDTVTQSWTCDGREFKLTAEISAHSRPHAMRAVAYKMSAGELVGVGTIDVKTTASTKEEIVTGTLVELKSGCPDFVFMNAEDHAYFKLILDEKSLTFLTMNLKSILNPELRLLVWSNLWQMVRDQRFKIAEFSDMAQHALKTERDLEILNYLLDRTVGTRWGEYDSVYYFWPRATEAEQASLSEMMQSYESSLYARMTREGGDRKKILMDGFLTALNTKDGLKKAASLLAKEKEQDRRWAVLGALCRENSENAESLVARELKSDRSDRGQKNALACRASMPNLQKKGQFLAQMTKPKVEYSADEVDRIAKNLFPARQRNLMAEYSSEILRALRVVWPNWEESYQEDLAYGLAPTYCEPQSYEKLGEFVRSKAEMPSTIRVPLQDKLDDDGRCIAIRKYNRL